MQYRWVGKNVNLNELSKRVKEFYKHFGFKTSHECSENTYRVIGALRIGDNVRLSSVNIKGRENDFVVEFLGSKGDRFSLFLGPLTTMFGGGVFLLDKLKSREFYEKLERDFWIFVEKTVEQLTAS